MTGLLRHEHVIRLMAECQVWRVFSLLKCRSVCRVQLAALHLRRAMRSAAGRTLRMWGSLAGITCFCVQHCTLAHPFLLADNR